MDYAITTTVTGTVEDALPAVREALASQGFGVLTEIDMAATLKTKIDVDIPGQVILGACNPPSAHRALAVEESIGLLLPCNVVVRDGGSGTVVVQAIDPQMMVGVTGNDQLAEVSDDVARRLRAALESLPGARSS